MAVTIRLGRFSNISETVKSVLRKKFFQYTEKPPQPSYNKIKNHVQLTH